MSFERSSCEVKSKMRLAFAVGKLCLDLAFHVRRRKEADGTVARRIRQLTSAATSLAKLCNLRLGVLVQSFVC